MRRYNTGHAFALSFFSAKLYQDVRTHWKGLGLLHLFVVLALSWIPMLVWLHMEINHFFDRKAPEILRQIPAIHFEQGEARLDENQPTLILKDPESQAVLAVLDLSGANPEFGAQGEVLLLTKTELKVRRAPSDVVTYSVRNFEGLSLDAATLQEMANLLQRWFPWILFPALILFSYAFRLLQAISLAAHGFLATRLLGIQLPVKALVRLTTVGMTPLILLDAIFLWVGMPLTWGISLGIGFLYLAFAILTTQEDEPAKTAKPTSTG